MVLPPLYSPRPSFLQAPPKRNPHPFLSAAPEHPLLSRSPKRTYDMLLQAQWDAEDERLAEEYDRELREKRKLRRLLPAPPKRKLCDPLLDDLLGDNLLDGFDPPPPAKKPRVEEETQAQPQPQPPQTPAKYETEWDSKPPALQPPASPNPKAIEKQKPKPQQAGLTMSQLRWRTVVMNDAPAPEQAEPEGDVIVVAEQQVQGKGKGRAKAPAKPRKKVDSKGKGKATQEEFDQQIKGEEGEEEAQPRVRRPTGRRADAIAAAAREGGRNNVPGRSPYQLRSRRGVKKEDENKIDNGEGSSGSAGERGTNNGDTRTKEDTTTENDNGESSGSGSGTNNGDTQKQEDIATENDNGEGSSGSANGSGTTSNDTVNEKEE
ncbi:hypothetical protein QBC46DRAFT_354222 [Diplogelasinospora grovesii]|uniref:Uncharacterized protein n=1 Tax=Diplogelasinospora grovesii TaxID=303347 RepID=A0AAN6S4M9_9PEZI|nr:hypothetical protein QBC46DRAFT_354222 [Diplogelasinospora grovesii]